MDEFVYNTNTRYINVLKENIIDYDSVKNNSFFKVQDGHVDVSVIIPVRSRAYFNEIQTKCLKSAMEFFRELKYSITFVEHSDHKEHEEFCTGDVNYIHIPARGNMFNKCLAMNAGAFLGKKADFYLFHDLDIMVRKDFFKNIMANLKRTDSRAIQPFVNRRVLYVNDRVSMAIRTGNLLIDAVKFSQDGVQAGTPGAPGGSLFVERNHFFEVGGYDAELFFGYSIEDQFFHDKLVMTGGVESCNNPPNEVFHLWHPPLWNSNPHAEDHDALYRNFKFSSAEDKIAYMRLKYEKNKKYL